MQSFKKIMLEETIAIRISNSRLHKTIAKIKKAPLKSAAKSHFKGAFACFSHTLFCIRTALWRLCDNINAICAKAYGEIKETK